MIPADVPPRKRKVKKQTAKLATKRPKSVLQIAQKHVARKKLTHNFSSVIFDESPSVREGLFYGSCPEWRSYEKSCQYTIIRRDGFPTITISFLSCSYPHSSMDLLLIRCTLGSVMGRCHLPSELVKQAQAWALAPVPCRSHPDGTSMIWMIFFRLFLLFFPVSK